MTDQMKRRGKVLADDLSTHLRGRILSGEYQPGDAITETGVAAEYGVARPSARNALERLIFDGLLVRHAHAALKVRIVEQSDVPELLSLLEFFERSAVKRILENDYDLRELRKVSSGSLPKFLHTLVVSCGSERLIQFHRQTMFALLLAPGTSHQGETGEQVNTLQLELTEGLFRMDREFVLESLAALWSVRTNDRIVADDFAS
ncbi:hypothetical protein CIK58_09625 [Brevibacterium aurantiacum]|uniref:GntR family transcriptional regulator n=1 Tax=Brevibacterium aurantiacum TaxID=273384 RepID=UPI000BB8FF08|nr:GntR family transcriptional regulator [Brevibacterium aurantiacum]PCC57356.1 hypothetical protein CIK58_09625 [Brevibacterium aurantiacum]